MGCDGFVCGDGSTSIRAFTAAAATSGVRVRSRR
jgi:hypothetical protein